jgi:hypothetical protein
MRRTRFRDGPLECREGALVDSRQCPCRGYSPLTPRRMRAPGLLPFMIPKMGNQVVTGSYASKYIFPFYETRVPFRKGIAANTSDVVRLPKPSLGGAEGNEEQHCMRPTMAPFVVT